MYSLEDGEPSVWDKELNDEADVENGNSVFAKPIVHKKIVEPKPKTERVESEWSKLRTANNKAIQSDKLNSLHRKQKFLISKWDLIKPFVGSIRPPIPDEAHDDETRLPLLDGHPSYIENATLRDYQVSGVNWLINSYCDSVNVILGGNKY
jgi:hypothetical protein